MLEYNMDINNSVAESKICQGYVARCKDQVVLRQSNSGGLFTPIANWTLERGGIVCAAGFDENLNVVHKIITNNDSLASCRGSKYVQSDMNQCYRVVKTALCSDQWVAFFGTPCQAYGLRAYLGKDFDKLVLVDLVCHSTPSPKLWRRYLSYLEEKYNSKVLDAKFRSKKYGYHVASMTVDFENKKQYCDSARTNLFLKPFFNGIASRPSCYCCRFKLENRCSDLTLYDAWHAEELSDEIMDDDKGFTNIIAHSNKGIQLLKSLDRVIDLYPVDYQKAIVLDGSMVSKSTAQHPKRTYFYTGIENSTLDEHIDRFLHISLKDWLIEDVKRLFSHFGVLNTLKKLLHN